MLLTLTQVLNSIFNINKGYLKDTRQKLAKNAPSTTADLFTPPSTIFNILQEIGTAKTKKKKKSIGSL
ncbi:hypothetical protein B0A54_18111 [Friedmanniomyces endolithicus]|uniref:Uncharacterized protein n=1 Tax=Friedmanniomyces endolithicus TaxID=329885 RepID=A0A4V5N2Y6_9PEZI|nr:hypothetical protein B0A54_18111 [Friedmanniomyces endolithicus]